VRYGADNVRRTAQPIFTTPPEVPETVLRRRNEKRKRKQPMRRSRIIPDHLRGRLHLTRIWGTAEEIASFRKLLRARHMAPWEILPFVLENLGEIKRNRDTNRLSTPSPPLT
jgi:hypothetical protein